METKATSSAILRENRDWIIPSRQIQIIFRVKRFDSQADPVYIAGEQFMNKYTIYTQCDHCGVYDRDPEWCTLCQKSKEARAAARRSNTAATPTRGGILTESLGPESKHRSPARRPKQACVRG